MMVGLRSHVIFCEDVREEKGNKYSLIGLYVGDCYFNEFPGGVLKLNIVIFLKEHKDDVRGAISIRATFPPPTEKFSIEIPEEHRKNAIVPGKDFVQAFIPISVVPWQVFEPGRVEVTIQRGTEPETINGMLVSLAPNTSPEAISNMPDN